MKRTISEIMLERVIILDGAMGTQIFAKIPLLTIMVEFKLKAVLNF